MTKEITQEQFNELVAQSKETTFLYFTAPWCGPCRMVGPIIDELSDEVNGVNFYKVNADNNPELMQSFGVRGIPSMFIIKNNEVVAARVGGASKSELQQWISSN